MLDRESARRGQWVPALAVALVAVLFPSAAAAAAGSVDGVGADGAAPKTRVYGGYYAAASQAPWVTSIQSSAGYRCTASLVAPDRVLTAAHCVDDPASGSWTA